MNASPPSLVPGLLKLRAEQDGIPLVFAPDLGGNVLYSRNLVSKLPPEINTFALPLTEAALAELDTITIERLAQDFAHLLIETWPKGPLHLGGYSFAGLLAFETARVLKTLRRPASHVWLFDTRAHRLHLPTAILQAPMHEIKYMLSYSYKTLIKGSQDDDDVLSSYRLLEVDLKTKPKAYWPIIRAFYSALSVYRPSLLTETPVTLFRIEEPIGHSARPHALGWDRLTKDNLAIETVDGDHKTIMTNPNSLEYIGDLLANEIVRDKGTR